jgi:hypothetical protein
VQTVQAFTHEAQTRRSSASDREILRLGQGAHRTRAVMTVIVIFLTFWASSACCGSARAMCAPA